MHENTVYILKNDTSTTKKLCMFGEKRRYIFQLSTLLLALAEMRRHNKSNHLCLNTKEETRKSVSV